MSIFETFGTVEEQGRVLVAGVPFAPGTEVEITITPKVRSADESEAFGRRGPGRSARSDARAVPHDQEVPQFTPDTA